MHPPAETATIQAVLLFSKPPVAGRVKTRLIDPLTAVQAAELHAAFLADLVERLSAQRFALVPVWAVEEGEAIPPPPGRRPGPARGPPAEPAEGASPKPASPA